MPRGGCTRKNPVGLSSHRWKGCLGGVCPRDGCGGRQYTEQVCLRPGTHVDRAGGAASGAHGAPYGAIGHTHARSVAEAGQGPRGSVPPESGAPAPPAGPSGAAGAVENAQSAAGDAGRERSLARPAAPCWPHWHARRWSSLPVDMASTAGRVLGSSPDTTTDARRVVLLHSRYTRYGEVALGEHTPPGEVGSRRCRRGKVIL